MEGRPHVYNPLGLSGGSATNACDRAHSDEKTAVEGFNSFRSFMAKPRHFCVNVRINGDGLSCFGSDADLRSQGGGLQLSTNKHIKINILLFFDVGRVHRACRKEGVTVRITSSTMSRHDGAISDYLHKVVMKVVTSTSSASALSLS